MRKVAGNSNSAKDFVHYLKTTLIPDLKESGMVETAKDFVTAVRLIETGRKDSGFVSYLKHTLIPDLIESGYDNTAIWDRSGDRVLCEVFLNTKVGAHVTKKVTGKRFFSYNRLYE